MTSWFGYKNDTQHLKCLHTIYNYAIVRRDLYLYSCGIVQHFLVSRYLSYNKNGHQQNSVFYHVDSCETGTTAAA
jgi:hypothetical protein